MRLLRVYTSPTCSPCKVLKPLLTDLGVEVEIIDIQAVPGAIRSANLKGVPTIDLVDGDAVIRRNVGFMRHEELKEFVA